MNKYAAKISEIMDSVQQTITGQGKTATWADNARTVYTGLVAGLKGYGGTTLTKTANSFNEAIPYIERAGYDVTEIEVGIGLSPKIVPHLKVRDILDDDEKAELLAEVQDKRMIYAILNSLFKATAARRRLKFNDYHFTEIEMELSLLPTVIIKSRPDKDAQNRARPDALIAEAKSLGLVDGEEAPKADKKPKKAP